MYPFGNDDGNLGEHAWYDSDSESKTHPVGQKRPNAWGLYDMQGNVWEWCADWYDEKYYASWPAADPRGTSRALARVIRGGSWLSNARLCRPAYRFRYAPEYRDCDLGFRLAADQENGTKPPVPPTPAPAPAKLVTNSIGMQLVGIEPGEFLMGSPESDTEASSDEKPQHRVRITEAFSLGIHEVTQGQYQAVMGETPSNFKGSDDLPVEHVSWPDAVKFCNKLSEREKRVPFYRIDGAKVAVAGGNGYRLPTEAEWEYACRAGSATVYPFGNDDGNLGKHAWYNSDSEFKTHPAGQKRPNAWGLYDMLGNVLEWCGDGYDEKYYASSPPADPPGASRPRTGSSGAVAGAASPGTAARRTATGAAGGPERRPGLPRGRSPRAGHRCLRAGEAFHGLAQNEAAHSCLRAAKLVTNSIGMQLVSIEPGEFLMGSPESDTEASSDEKPQHRVRITEAFSLGIHEVTQGQYQAVMEETPSSFKGSDDLPVENVSWLDAVKFCNKLSEREKRVPFYRIDGAEVCRGLGRAAPGRSCWRQRISSSNRGGVGIRLPGGERDRVSLWQ